MDAGKVTLTWRTVNTEWGGEVDELDIHLDIPGTKESVPDMLRMLHAATRFAESLTPLPKLNITTERPPGAGD